MSLLYDSDNYELITSSEIEKLLAELPFDLMKENIINQINDPVSTNVNYMETIIIKCDMFKDSFSDNPDLMKQVDDALYEFMAFIINKIDNRFDLGVDLDMGLSYDNMIEYGRGIYRYFILRYEKNISKFIVNYISENEKELVKYYSDKNKKDVSTLAYKKQIKNMDALTIISNLPSIVNYIVNIDIEPEEFVSLSAGENNYDAHMIKRLIMSDIITGDFVRPYVDNCIDNHDGIIDEIYTRIKTKLIKQYKMN